MELNIYNKILQVFFEDPHRSYLIREISRKTKINHTSVRQYLKELVKEEILVKEEEGLYKGYSTLFSRKYVNLKLFYNLEKLRKSGIIEAMQKHYDFPEMVVFGSYSKAIDDLESDIDICVITDIDKEFKTEKYEKELNRKVSLHIFNSKRWGVMKEKNKELINNICNGITISGSLEVI